MSRLVCLLIAIVLSLLSVAASAAPVHKRPAPRWHGYGFLPGYQQPLSNSIPLYAKKDAMRRLVSRERRSGYIDPVPVTTGMMASDTISAGPAFTAAATMGLASARVGRGHRSGRCGIAADQSVFERSGNRFA